MERVLFLLNLAGILHGGQLEAPLSDTLFFSTTFLFQTVQQLNSLKFQIAAQQKRSAGTQTHFRLFQVLNYILASGGRIKLVFEVFFFFSFAPPPSKNYGVCDDVTQTKKTKK